MLTQIHITSSLFQKSFSYLKQSFPDLIEEVRGVGLILGLQLKAVGAKTASDIAGLVVKHARENGLLVITAGEGTIRFVPPLNISEETVSEGLLYWKKLCGMSRRRYRCCQNMNHHVSWISYPN
jgi:acetylornithine aminotransferase